MFFSRRGGTTLPRDFGVSRVLCIYGMNVVVVVDVIIIYHVLYTHIYTCRSYLEVVYYYVSTLLSLGLI